MSEISQQTLFACWQEAQVGYKYPMPFQDVILD